jgi:excinuclease ABC subunit B
LRRGEFDVLIGINLLREGLDLPEVSLVAVLDADKEGFLRSADSLIQTVGRAARHLRGMAILYADTITDSMKRAIGETNRRREIQERYNRENNITPESIVKPVDMTLVAIAEADYVQLPGDTAEETTPDDPEKIAETIARLEGEMREAARKFEFERAASLRDKARALRTRLVG